MDKQNAHADRGILFSDTEKCAIKPARQMWRNLKCLLLSERSQSEKTTYCMIPVI